MKSLSVLLLVLCFGVAQAQSSFNYNKAWKEIEYLNKQQGQVKSLLIKVEEIYQQAQKDDNWQQRIRAFIYKEGIQSRITDDKDYEVVVIQDFMNEIRQAKGAPKAILQSMLAETYLDYYNLNRRKIDERTAVEGLNDDFRYWSKDRFKEEAQKLYKTSIKEESVLKNDPISDWDFLLEREKETDYLRPTLYDFIAYRYINSIENKQFDLSTKERQNLLDEIWNNLIQFHEKQKNDAALAYNKLQLLKLYKTGRPKEFETGLRQLITSFSNNKYTPNLLFEGAKLYIEKFENAPHGAFDDKKKYADKILFYSNGILKRFPKSDLSKAAQNNVKRLTAPYFTLKTEDYNIPKKDIPVGITYRNLDKLHFRIFKFDEGQKKFIENLSYGQDSEKQKNLTRLFNTFQEVNHFELPLKEFDDYQSRSTIGKISGFSAGYYVVVASNDSGFNYDNKNTRIQTQVLYFTPYKLTTQRSHILLTDRETGKPVSHKKIYVYNTEKTSELLKTLTTNDKGRADYNSDFYFLNYKVEGDPVLLNDRNMHSVQELGTEVRKTLQFFTDRKIYRPGQNIFYKIVAYETPPKGARYVSENKDLQITLNDVNGKKVAEQNLTTNEFGSVSGEFVLPNDGLNGQYSLRVINGDWESSLYYFKVEDYKRPKFKVELTVKDTVYKLDQEVLIDGKAMSYSGASLNSVQVTYSIIRQPVFSFLPWWQRYIIPNRVEGQQIASGETTTDENGDFTVNFKAIPGEFPEPGGVYPRKTSKDRSFRYDIIADVTDINGETQTGRETVNVGDQEYVIKLPIQDKVDLTTLDAIPFQLQNLNGKPVSAKGGLMLTKLKAPDRVLRNSELGTTDYELFEKQDFIKYFPNQPYANEDKIENWQTGDTVFKERFDAVGTDYIDVDSKDWEPGYYRLKGFIVNKNDTITQEKLVYFYNPKNRFPVDNELFSAELNKAVLQAGEKGKVYFSSAAKDAQVFVQVEANQDIVEERWIRLDQESKTFEFPIKETYRGKVYVYYYFGKYNTAYRKELAADVNTEREKLTIKTKVFRDKLKPGNDETWEFTITGKDKDKIWAEVLATMYDTSLDKFEANSLQFNPVNYHRYARYGSWSDNFMGVSGFRWLKGEGLGFDSFSHLQFTSLNWFDFKTWFSGLFRPEYPYLGGVRIQTMRKQAMTGNPAEPSVSTADDVEEERLINVELADLEAEDIGSPDAENIDLNTVAARKNLQETAFFYPELHTDKEGNVVLKFTVPESLTEWKLMANAYTADLKTGYLEKSVVTQKELMVTPNPPRFLREGDSITLSAKVDNRTDKEMKGKIRLSLFDPIKEDALDVEFANADAEKDFEIAKNSATNLSWKIYVPEDYSAVSYRFVTATTNYSDGEENVLPILTNRKLVTETLPIHIREGEERTFILKNLQENTSKTREDLRLTLEMTANPIWQAIFSLPYLRTPKYDNSISNFGQLYGNLISRKILTDNPKIEAVFKDWRTKGELKSKLELNQDLKEILLEETPWVRDAESESEKMKRLAFLFDSNKIATELQATFNRLLDKQLDNGGFSWFDGGEANRYVTNHLLFSFGHLEDLGIDIDTLFDGQAKAMIDKMIAYVDREALSALERTEKEKNNDFYKTSFFRSYLWARGNYLNTKPLPKKLMTYKNKALDAVIKEKFDLPIHTQAKVVFVLENYGRHQEAVALLKSLKDRAVISEEMGMYWRDNQPGWLWQEAPIATHSLLTLAFDKILKDEEAVENLKVWLLKNRQTNQWNSIKSTTEAVNVLVSTGRDWMNVDENGLDLKVGNKTIDLSDNQTQSGSGYFKKTWEKAEMKPEMAKVEVKKEDPGVAWGALYWQYFEDLDQIESADSKVVMRKQLYLKENTEEGVRLTEITDKTPIKVGDLVTVRLELQTDRDMQFIHLKDMRASGFEPVNVLSQYKYKHGLGYYESTRDAATHFFFDAISKGTYVFEYDLRANNSGDFSNGITTLQNAYAPELSTHSKGIRVQIKQ